MENILDLEKLIKLSRDSAGVVTLPGEFSPAMLVPNGYNLRPLEDLRLDPRMVKQQVKFQDLESFIRYVGAFKKAETIIFGQIGDTASSVLAIIDYHHGSIPEHCAHRALYECPLSKNWRTWTEASGPDKWMSQETFARFIEMNLPDVAEPAGAVLLEMVNTLEASRNIRFAKAIRMQSGSTRLHWEDETVNKAGERADMELPKTITLAVRCFINGPIYQLECWLRYRVQNGGVQFCIETIRPHKIIEDATKLVFEQIEKETKIKPYLAIG